MTNIRKKALATGTRVLDIAVMMVTFAASLYYYAPQDYPRGIVEYLSIKIKLINVIIFFIYMIGWNRLFAMFGLYEVRRLGNILHEWFDIIKAITVGVLFLAGISFFIPTRNINGQVVLTFWVSCVILTILARTIVRKFLIYLRSHGRNLRFIVFVGSGPRAVDLAQKVTHRSELGYSLLGYIDDNFDHFTDYAIPASKQLCRLDELGNFLENNIVDEVFVCLPIKSFYEKINDIVQLCQELGIVCRVPSDSFNFKTSKTAAFVLNGVPMLSILNGSKHQLELFWLKRLTDVVLSGIAFGLTAPFFLIIAILIKIDSKGPIFYFQERIGYNRRPFFIYKFRTMVRNAERMQLELEYLNEADGPAFKIDKDPRITRIGKWLRKTSLDELPQLINVLKGEMSLVGPRPLPVRDVQGIDERWQKRRFSMLPGLTCLWQINGRHKVRFHEWMRLDIEYIDKWSLGLDFKILLKTVPTILKAKGQ